ncbi:N-formylglutamate amidohydrolase [Parasphingorhabdus sp.]|uniref:N-formylglutamate amidohydrolase n=1 Tax=Parasphingorhabdus sp. TaxID=2709688 RepID=UPI0009EF24D2
MPSNDNLNRELEKLPFSVFNEDKLAFPVLVSVPHAGRLYPAEVHDNLRVSKRHLLRLEDRYADRLATSAIESGFSTVIAQKPRAWIDLNRSRTELDPGVIEGLDMTSLPNPSRKVRGGLGLVPRSLSGVGGLWQEKWSQQQISKRIGQDHEPYHQLISQILYQLRLKFGGAILLDLHSMPTIVNDGEQPPDFVIGDRFGRSSASQFSELSHAFFRNQGYHAQINHPYAGGYILERHSNMNDNIHAIQIEVDRRLYLDESFCEPLETLGKISQLVGNLTEMLSDQMTSRKELEAAE